jgi:hypothetical protein
LRASQDFDLITICHPIPSECAWSKRQRRKGMKILMVLTSHDQLGDTGGKTGFWLEEFAAPYSVF